MSTVKPKILEVNEDLETLINSTSLSYEDKELIVAKFIEGRTYSHLGERLGVGVERMRCRVHKSLRRLRRDTYFMRMATVYANDVLGWRLDIPKKVTIMDVEPYNQQQV
jgi:hypothetical protein